MNLRETDPELMERFEYFASTEVLQETGQTLSDEVRDMTRLATLIGSQSVDMYRDLLAQVLEKESLSPVMVKEIIYQAVDYLGMGRARPFLTATNDVFENKGISLPLARQATTTMDNRLEKGVQAQVAIFGDQMQEAWQESPINRWLASNCFGDFYTRTGLDLKQREMITFCFLLAQGGCEPQLLAHAKGNMKLGNDKAFLTSIIYQSLPYIGYPRSLNALRCVNEAMDS